MRGGAIPLLAWGTVLLVLYAINWIWEGRAVQAAETVFAVFVIYGAGLLLWLARREAIRPGPPEPRAEPEAVPRLSLSAVLVGLSMGCLVFGIAWSKFLVYFGAGLLLASLGRMALEVRAERRSREALRK